MLKHKCMCIDSTKSTMHFTRPPLTFCCRHLSNTCQTQNHDMSYNGYRMWDNLLVVVKFKNNLVEEVTCARHSKPCWLVPGKRSCDDAQIFDSICNQHLALCRWTQVNLHTLAVHACSCSSTWTNVWRLRGAHMTLPKLIQTRPIRLGVKMRP